MPKTIATDQQFTEVSNSARGDYCLVPSALPKDLRLPLFAFTGLEILVDRALQDLHGC